jgi:hypothetical protein
MSNDQPVDPPAALTEKTEIGGGMTKWEVETTRIDISGAGQAVTGFNDPLAGLPEAIADWAVLLTDFCAANGFEWRGGAVQFAGGDWCGKITDDVFILKQGSSRPAEFAPHDGICAGR